MMFVLSSALFPRQAHERLQRFWLRSGVVSLLAIIFVVYCLPKVSARSVLRFVVLLNDVTDYFFV